MKSVLTIREAHSDKDLHQILDLQRINVRSVLSPESAKKDGFLTCEHDFELLNKMNSPYRHTICLHDNDLVGYCLVLLPRWREELCVLQSMFEQLDQQKYKGRQLIPEEYVLVGQVCVREEFRGQGVFREMYHNFRSRLSPYFSYCITEVDANNVRSLNAHLAIGFQRLNRYQPGDGHDWVLIIWEWRASDAIAETTSNL